MPKTPTKKDHAQIIMLVLAGVAAFSTLAGYLLKSPNQNGAVISTQLTTESPATDDAKVP